MGDVDLSRTLWISINNVVVPTTPVNKTPTAVFLMESPGFSVDPEDYDPDNFQSSDFSDRDRDRMHPDRAIAQLADRVPAVSPYFFDSGTHISYYWRQLLETYKLSWSPKDDPKLREKYENAVKMLYGSDEDDFEESEKRYFKDEKSEFHKQLEAFSKNWESAKKEEKEFLKTCQNDPEKLWPKNFQQSAGPTIDKTIQAFTEYDNLKAQIQQYQAAISQYTRGDLSRLLLAQMQAMDKNTKYDSGESGCGSPYYATTMEPKDWWKWFRDDDKDNSGGWTQIIVTEEAGKSSSSETFTKMSYDVSAGYGPYVAEVGVETESGRKHASESFKGMTITFQIRKVLIHRPWMEIGVLQNPTLGIAGLKAGAWSTGKLEPNNTGQFPLLPTAMIVARNVIIRFAESQTERNEAMESMKMKVSAGAAVGPFSAKVSVGHESGSAHTDEQYEKKGSEISIKEAQIIGWVCTVLPRFPAYTCGKNEDPGQP